MALFVVKINAIVWQIIGKYELLPEFFFIKVKV